MVSGVSIPPREPPPRARSDSPARYQPVSYRLHSRMGTRTELRAMIQTCRSAGVRVYADAVVNHMVGQGNGRQHCPGYLSGYMSVAHSCSFVPDIQNHRYVDRNGDCIRYSGHNATAGSPYFTSGWVRPYFFFFFFYSRQLADREQKHLPPQPVHRHPSDAGIPRGALRPDRLPLRAQPQLLDRRADHHQGLAGRAGGPQLGEAVRAGPHRIVPRGPDVDRLQRLPHRRGQTHGPGVPGGDPPPRAHEAGREHAGGLDHVAGGHHGRGVGPAGVRRRPVVVVHQSRQAALGQRLQCGRHREGQDLELGLSEGDAHLRGVDHPGLAIRHTERRPRPTEPGEPLFSSSSSLSSLFPLLS